MFLQYNAYMIDVSALRFWTNKYGLFRSTGKWSVGEYFDWNIPEIRKRSIPYPQSGCLNLSFRHRFLPQIKINRLHLKRAGIPYRPFLSENISKNILFLSKALRIRRPVLWRISWNRWFNLFYELCDNITIIVNKILQNMYSLVCHLKSSQCPRAKTALFIYKLTVLCVILLRIIWLTHRQQSKVHYLLLNLVLAASTAMMIWFMPNYPLRSFASMSRLHCLKTVLQHASSGGCGRCRGCRGYRSRCG